MEAGHGNRACFLWEGNGAPVFRARTMSYREVLDEVCRLVGASASSQPFAQGPAQAAML